MYTLSAIKSLLSDDKSRDLLVEKYCKTHDADYVITQLAYDSRKLVNPTESLFFALNGEQRKGSEFIAHAYEQGVRAFVTSSPSIQVDNFPNASFLIVRDALSALQLIAKKHRQRFDFLHMIGITGSNGKTIVKEWLYQILSDKFQVARSPGSFNSQIGVPLSAWQIRPIHDLAILEAGISQPNEMTALAEIIDCTIGIFTNIGSAHSANFNSLAQKVEEKVKLFTNAKTIIYCADYPDIHRYFIQNEQNYESSLIGWSLKGVEEAVQVSVNKSSGTSAIVTIDFIQKVYTFELPFTNPSSTENAIHCIIALIILGMNQEFIQTGIGKLRISLPMRLEVSKGILNSRLINDSYTSDLESLEAALGFLEQHSGNQARVVILSDLVQSSMDNEQLYRQVAKMIKKRKIQAFIGVGNGIRSLKSYLSVDTLYFFEDTATFLQSAPIDIIENAVVLIKGARKFEFEKIATYYAKHSHRSKLEVKLRAIKHNLNIYRDHLPKGTKIMAMVKAAAYGAGSEEVARYLQAQHIHALAVAYTDEGVELRNAGVHLPILVLNPEIDSFQLLHQHNLQAEIYDLKQLQELSHYLGKKTKGFEIHLKLNTGMNRLGFDMAQLDDLLKHILDKGYLIVAIMTHMASSSNSADDVRSHAQVALFGRMYTVISSRLGYQPDRHLLNSAGLLRFPEYAYEMVRLGIGLYGVDDTGIVQPKLEAALQLTTVVSQVRKLPAGASVGYGYEGKLQKDSIIATLAIGYADGLPRLCGNGKASVHIRNKSAPLIGNVCMDMCMADVSHIEEVSIGDQVEVFGSNNAVEELAKAALTVPYEVFSRVPARVPRVYIEE